MVELVDTLVSGASAGFGMGVRVPLRAQEFAHDYELKPKIIMVLGFFALIRCVLLFPVWKSHLLCSHSPSFFSEILITC